MPLLRSSSATLPSASSNCASAVAHVRFSASTCWAATRVKDAPRFPPPPVPLASRGPGAIGAAAAQGYHRQVQQRHLLGPLLQALHPLALRVQAAVGAQHPPLLRGGACRRNAVGPAA